METCYIHFMFYSKGEKQYLIALNVFSVQDSEVEFMVVFIITCTTKKLNLLLISCGKGTSRLIYTELDLLSGLA